MKRTLTYISGVLLLITALCISCQKEQNSLEEKGAPANEVVIRATISDAATKVSFTEDDNKLKTAWETDDSIVGWDAEGNAIELEIASIEDNTAIFKTVEGSAPIPTSGKVYMIYAPGKHYTDVSEESLTYVLGSQNENSVPALMTATGSVSNNVLALNFINRLAIVAVKNPKFQVTEATPITGLQLSGDNILTTATFSEDESGELQMSSSEPGAITKACNFTTATDGTTSETMVYFAVLPNTTEANVTVSTSNPTGYQILFENKLFEAGKCYMLNQKDINKQTFTVTVADGITGGTITTNPTSGSSVAWGETVTVTATPDTGYELTTLTYNDGSDHDIKALGTFTMPAKNVTVTATFEEPLTGTINSHNYVKIGGKKWATTNLGATNPQDYGNLYSWGNPTGKSGNSFSPGFTSGNYGSPGNDVTEDTGETPWEKETNDAAYNDWGSPWRMPTSAEFKALYDACLNGIYDKTTNPSGASASVGKGVYWCTSYDGVAGCLFCDGTNKLFFPAAGYSNSDSRTEGGISGYYWSSTCYSSGNAYDMCIKSSSVNPQLSSYRYRGFSVRPLSD